MKKRTRAQESPEIKADQANDWNQTWGRGLGCAPLSTQGLWGTGEILWTDGTSRDCPDQGELDSLGRLTDVVIIFGGPERTCSQGGARGIRTQKKVDPLGERKRSEREDTERDRLGGGKGGKLPNMPKKKSHVAGGFKKEAGGFHGTKEGEMSGEKKGLTRSR